jgi:hypothetical protein
MDAYNPDVAPTPSQWLELDEGEAVIIIEDYHKDTEPEVEEGRLRLHAVIHSVVENQIASKNPEQTAETLERLMSEGLSRHNAIHAIGTLVSDLIFEVMNEQREVDPEAYAQKLSLLTAEDWLALSQEDDL